MNQIEMPSATATDSALEVAKYQASHILITLTNPVPEGKDMFLAWYKEGHHHAVAKLDNVLTAQHFEPHEIDIMQGAYPAPDYQYLGIYELCLDGAEQAQDIISFIHEAHKQESSADTPATWLYYPISEKVGRPAQISNPMVTLAFANGIPNSDDEFREWYCTRHLRHALHIPVFVNGQCFGPTGFQNEGSMALNSSLIALYEWEGGPQDYFDYLNSVSEEVGNKLTEMLSFPTLDTSRFGECVYRPITEKLVAEQISL